MDSYIFQHVVLQKKYKS